MRRAGPPPAWSALAVAGVIVASILATVSPSRAVVAAGWGAESSTVDTALYAVSFSDALHGHAVGAHETILVTDDGGRSWRTQRQELSPGNLYGVSFPTQSHGYAVGEGRMVLTTTNGGETWSKYPVNDRRFTVTDPRFGSRLFGVSFTDASRGHVVGDGGNIAATTNGGVVWTMQFACATTAVPCNEVSPGRVTATLRGVAFVDATRGWVVGEAGTILSTVDGGATWVTRASGTTHDLFGVAFVDATHGWVVGASGTILSTADGGATWSPRPACATASAACTPSSSDRVTTELRSVSFPTATHGYVVGGAGTILSSTDGGNTWSAEDAATTADLFGVSFGDATQPGIGHAVGAQGRIRKRVEAPPAPVLSGIRPAAGATLGNDVVLEGSGLSGATSVRFGDRVVEDITAVSDTAIVTRAPPRTAGAVSVVVTGPGGTSPPVTYTYFEPTGGTWTPARPLLTGRSDHTATLLADGRVLVAGGVNAAGQLLASAEVYDPVSGRWSPTQNTLFTARRLHSATRLEDGRVLVAGGNGPPVAGYSNLISAEVYDPQDNMWHETGPMLYSVAEHPATLLTGPGCGRNCGKVLVFSGRVAQLYDPAADSGRGAWTMTQGRSSAAPSASRDRHTATLLTGPGCEPDCGKVLMAGGNDQTRGAPFVLDSAELYDPATETWMDTGSMAVPRWYHHAAIRLGDGRVLVTGGDLGRSAEIYDPHTRSWSLTGTTNRPRGSGGTYRFEALLPGGQAFFPGGGTAEVWDPEAVSPITGRPGSWSYVPSPRHSYGTTTVTGLLDGRVLVAGDGSYLNAEGVAVQDLASVELFTPAPTVSRVEPPSGPQEGGTTITITGTGLAQAASVSFGVVAAPAITRVSDTTLTAVSPAHAPGPVDITVTGPGGTSAQGVGGRFTYTGVPGRVDLVVTATSPTEVTLGFAAVGSHGDAPPAVTRYEIRESTAAIVGEDGFAAADPLCGASCDFAGLRVGDPLSVPRGGLDPDTTYHYAIRPVGAFGELGPISTASVHTPGLLGPPAGEAPPCSAVGEPGQGQVRYPGGRYSLVGAPEGTVVRSSSPLYGWFDLGAGGAYSIHDAVQPATGGRGYWAWFSCARLVDLAGPGTSSARASLGAYHASIVANPSATSPATLSGHDYAARWDPDANAGVGGYHISGYREAQSLAVGEGIWAFSFVPAQVVITAGAP